MKKDYKRFINSIEESCKDLQSMESDIYRMGEKETNEKYKYIFMGISFKIKKELKDLYSELEIIYGEDK